MYYKDDTHYFVMTAKKVSLLKKGVLKAVSRTFTLTHTHTHTRRNQTFRVELLLVDIYFSTDY